MPTLLTIFPMYGILISSLHASNVNNKRSLYIIHNINITAALWGAYYYYLHFSDEETEVLWYYVTWSPTSSKQWKWDWKPSREASDFMCLVIILNHCWKMAFEETMIWGAITEKSNEMAEWKYCQQKETRNWWPGNRD